MGRNSQQDCNIEAQTFRPGADPIKILQLKFYSMLFLSILIG